MLCSSQRPSERQRVIKTKNIRLLKKKRRLYMRAKGVKREVNVQ